jgi:hypothetical protein
MITIYHTMKPTRQIPNILFGIIILTGISILLSGSKYITSKGGSPETLSSSKPAQHTTAALKTTNPAVPSSPGSLNECPEPGVNCRYKTVNPGPTTSASLALVTLEMECNPTFWTDYLKNVVSEENPCGFFDLHD